MRTRTGSRRRRSPHHRRNARAAPESARCGPVPSMAVRTSRPPRRRASRRTGPTRHGRGTRAIDSPPRPRHPASTPFHRPRGGTIQLAFPRRATVELRETRAVLQPSGIVAERDERSATPVGTEREVAGVTEQEEATTVGKVGHRSEVADAPIVRARICKHLEFRGRLRHARGNTFDRPPARRRDGADQRDGNQGDRCREQEAIAWTTRSISPVRALNTTNASVNALPIFSREHRPRAGVRARPRRGS